MYTADLEMYQFKTPFVLPNVRMVGWLDSHHSFNKGSVPKGFSDKLLQIIDTQTSSFDLHVNVIRGTHDCNFCNEEIWLNNHLERRLRRPLGMSELWVPNSGGWFASPTLIYHYVERHEYLPPEDYVNAVLQVRLDQRHIAQEVFDGLCSTYSRQNN